MFSTENNALAICLNIVDLIVLNVLNEDKQLIEKVIRTYISVQIANIDIPLLQVLFFIKLTKSLRHWFNVI